MFLEMERLSPKERYKLLTALVVPRPIALVTTVSPEGVLNAAPFSFFNVLAQDPPLLVLGIGERAPGMPKDTARNIARSGEFVVHLVDEPLAEAMNLCAVDFPAEVSELDHASVRLEPSRLVAPARIQEAPAAFECRRHVDLPLGRAGLLVIGRVLCVHLRDGLIDGERLRVDYERYRPVGRLCGDLYCRIHERFAMRRRSYREWLAERETEGR